MALSDELEALVKRHGALSYRNRADTQNPAYGFTEDGLNGLIGEALAKWGSPQPVVREPSEAEIVFAAISSGEWTVTRNQPSCYLTDEGNARNTWSVQRAVAPYCADLGPGKGRGNRCWNGPTALAALKAASKEIGIPLPITQKGGSNAE